MTLLFGGGFLLQQGLFRVEKASFAFMDVFSRTRASLFKRR
jgi:hypothetical protein